MVIISIELYTGIGGGIDDLAAIRGDLGGIFQKTCIKWDIFVHSGPGGLGKPELCAVGRAESPAGQNVLGRKIYAQGAFHATVTSQWSRLEPYRRSVTVRIRRALG